MRKVSMRLAAVLVLVSLLLGLRLGTGFAAAAVATPGSDQDPLVTKSYVDQAIAKLQQAIDSLIGQGGGSSDPGTGGGTELKVVVVPAGQKLIGFEGTEFILRAGSGKIIAGSAGGVPDLTGAVDLAHGAVIPKNHLLLFPKSDQRGFLSVGGLTVMVRGRYQVLP